MTQPAKPFTPKTLARRWDCTPMHVRRLVAAGRLQAFRLGRLIRIRQLEVERFEAGQCQQESGSSSIVASGASTGATTGEGH
ncbi:MAG: helix-turn-helix domain-containing protein, partial [Planctomycetes bacterium]|nr:helix-turn-helix domain-containing protein [Planctomycetota bacterium]